MTYPMDMHWCITHRSAIDEPPFCIWDRLVGPRPGRGECRMVQALVTIKECDHEWKDATNDIIMSGYWCPKCNAIKDHL